MPIPESQIRSLAVEIRRRIPRRFRMDLVVRSPEEIAYRISHNDWFLREVTQEGQVLYESVDTRVVTGSHSPFATKCPSAS